MRCTDALEQMTALTAGRHLEDNPELSAHVGQCPSCARAWRGHLALLAELGSPPPLPPFPDLAPAVLSRLEGHRAGHADTWRRAAVAALALLALVLGYLWGAAGRSAAPSTPDTVTATYQEALAGHPSGSAELAYLGKGSSAEPAAFRSAP